ncbi:MAG: hypothetical protein OSB46_00730 [Alphaproteobacteria bacterium]|nr:hypothetical protein [Alphaproteobacteria bacterium]
MPIAFIADELGPINPNVYGALNLVARKFRISGCVWKLKTFWLVYVGDLGITRRSI